MIYVAQKIIRTDKQLISKLKSHKRLDQMGAGDCTGKCGLKSCTESGDSEWKQVLLVLFVTALLLHRLIHCGGSEAAFIYRYTHFLPTTVSVLLDPHSNPIRLLCLLTHTDTQTGLYLESALEPAQVQRIHRKIYSFQSTF